jgi:CheY-like chemotaxis protein
MSRFEQLITGLTDPVFELDAEGNVAYATPALAAWTGREFSPATLYQFADILGPKDRTRFNQAFKRVVDGKTLKTAIPLHLKAKNATVHGAVELTLSAFPASGDSKSAEPKTRGAGKKAINITAYLRDTRAEKKAEAYANLQSAHLLDLVENISDACVVENADGSVEMVNEAFCELFAIDVAPQSWVSTSCASLFELASMVVDGNAGPIYAPSTNHAHAVTTLSLLQGQKQIAHAIHTVMDSDEGQAGAAGFAGRLHLFKVVTNATIGDAPRHGNAATHSAKHTAARVQLQFIERIRADLAATIEAAFSAIQRAEQVELSGHALEHFRRVEASAHTAVNAIASLVDLADEDANNIMLEASPFRLRESIAGVFNLLVPRAEELGIEMTLRLEQDVPETLTGDGARLMMALRHLIEIGLSDIHAEAQSDAERTARRRAKIALMVQPEYTDNDVIHLSFTVEHDTPNISAELDTITTTTMSSMQLALARQLARALAAHDQDPSQPSESRARHDIEVHQKQNKKNALHLTSYKFAAPFKFTADDNEHIRPAFVTLTGMQVLLVSADAHERARLAELMRNWRMLPSEADDAAMALQLLNRMAEEKNAIPLVITSNQLPLQDGFLLAFRIKHHPKLSNTHVMMLAKNGRPGDAIQCREAGISAYLRDPISPDQLVDAIGAVMGTKDDAEATQTLITRHSLREAKTGTVLLIDAHHDQAMIAATFLKRRDFRVVVVDTAEAAAASLTQDIFDVIIADSHASGFDSKLSIAQQLRLNFPDGADIPILLAMTDFAKINTTEYQGVITKPYEKVALLEKVAAAMMAKTAVIKSRRASDQVN